MIRLFVRRGTVQSMHTQLATSARYSQTPSPEAVIDPAALWVMVVTKTCLTEWCLIYASQHLVEKWAAHRMWSLSHMKTVRNCLDGQKQNGVVMFCLSGAMTAAAAHRGRGRN